MTAKTGLLVLAGFATLFSNSLLGSCIALFIAASIWLLLYLPSNNNALSSFKLMSLIVPLTLCLLYLKLNYRVLQLCSLGDGSYLWGGIGFYLMALNFPILNAQRGVKEWDNTFRRTVFFWSC